MDMDLGGIKCYDEMNNDIETTENKAKTVDSNNCDEVEKSAK